MKGRCTKFLQFLCLFDVTLQVYHDRVVDTSVVFPHRQGPPYKRALKTLMAEILQRIIQEDGMHLFNNLYEFIVI